MEMSTWVIISWIFVALLTAINIFIFLKLKNASEQMLKMAFPGAKDMNEALAQMQGMMGSMQNRQGRRMAGAKGMDAQLRQAMDMLNKKGSKRR